MLRRMVIFLCLALESLMATAPLNQGLSPLIPREVLFGNPEKAGPQISPDGKRLAYLAPVNGVLNVWVKTVGQNDEHPVSKDTDRGVRGYTWAYNNKHLLYVQDKGGDENWHIYRVDLETEQTVDLTPFDGVLASFCAANKNYPDESLILMNKENPQLFDVYHLNIATGVLELREKNPGNVAAYIADSNLQVKAAQTFNADGGSSLLLRATEKDAWKTVTTWDFEDVMSAAVFGFSRDGKKLYLKDSLESNTVRLIEYDCASGSRKVLAQDSIFDVTGFIKDSNEKPLAALFLKERFAWLALDDDFAPTLKAMQHVDDGDLMIDGASIDGRYWIIGFLHDNQSHKYYLFDKKERKAEFLFAFAPELNKYQLAPMEPISFTARDGLKIYGYLTCPVGVGRKNLPLVLNVHGGPWYRDTWATNPEAQWLADRGYACLQVNFRGSTGYGKAFMNAGNRE
jgi:dipeptidyl aminopeptidase/acylaminoacyl peptidase